MREEKTQVSCLNSYIYNVSELRFYPGNLSSSMLLTAASLRYLKYNRQDFFPLHVALRVTEQFHNRIWDRNELLGMFVGVGGNWRCTEKGLGRTAMSRVDLKSFRLELWDLKSVLSSLT